LLYRYTCRISGAGGSDELILPYGMGGTGGVLGGGDHQQSLSIPELTKGGEQRCGRPCRTESDVVRLSQSAIEGESCVFRVEVFGPKI
jgi:hypothetical protein